jgi:hypothetical protein
MVLPGESPARNLFLADAHVHFHAGFEPHTFLAAAARNFADAARRIHPLVACRGVLLLTESAGVDWFRRLQDAPPAGWWIEPTAEPESLIACGPRGERLTVVAGRQVVTAERLEVLWLGTREQPADGHPIHEVIPAARAAGAVPALPWGFGKWTGRRRRVMRGLLTDPALGSVVHFGDNSGRPAFWPAPRWFRKAAGRRQRVLPGSDPLPFPDQGRRAGSFGFYGHAELGWDRPWRDLKAVIDGTDVELRRYGRLEAPLRFVRHQVAMQWRRRERRPAGAAA